MPFTLDSIQDLDAVMQRRTAAAESASASHACQRLIAYGPDPDHTLDFYPAQSLDGPSPLVLFIHGGFWRSMRASQFSFLARGFVDQGVSLAVIDYPLIPRVRMEQVVHACRLALAHVLAHSHEMGIDADRVVVAGNSAGGHLVAELMDTHWMAAMGLPDTCLRGGVAISGLYDLVPVALSVQNESLHLTAEETSRYSPLIRSVHIRAPLVLAVGGDETSEFLRQTAAFAAHAQAHGTPTQHLVVPHTNHITVVLDGLARRDNALNVATHYLLSGN
jgi:arylformamidase